MKRGFLGIALGSCLCAASTAQATYSIAAVDMSTGQVGGAITSCVGTLDVGIVYGSAPGKGVIHAQALLDQRGRAKTQAIELLQQGVAPSAIVMQLTAASFDASFESRQYGVVDLMGRAAGFTGADAQAYKHDQQARVGPFAYSVQGNILTSQKVLDQASAAFEGQACDLAEKLMLALEAGAKNGEGDSRCTGQGIPSDSAFIEVDLMGEAAGSYLKLSVMGTAPDNPLVRLRAQFDAWRKQHPCAAAAGSAGAAASSGGAAGVGAPAAGGAAAGGGGPASGGAAAVGGGVVCGDAASGSAPGSGGAAAVGGGAACEGAASGGAPASGGAAAVGGAACGDVASGSAPGTGGAAAVGGATVCGGAASGGALAAGAASAGVGGVAAVGGADASAVGGREAAASRAAAGSSAAAQAASGGSRASTDTAAASGLGSAGVGQVSAAATAASDAGGCGCNLARRTARRSSAAFALSALALALIVRVRRRRS